jgi:SPP1 family predicted phage head-tail adaptor
MSSVSDGQGGFTDTWNDVATVFASIEPVKGYERFQAMQMQTPITHKIVMRYRDDVTTASRFTLGARIFAAQEVINQDERSRFLLIKAVERA